MSRGKERFAQHVATHKQNEPIPDKEMVKNSDGAYVFEVGPFDLLRRFLILGSDGGSYYATEEKLTKDNAKNIVKCAQMDHERTVKEIVEVSQGGLAPKNEFAVFALAIVAKLGNEEARRAAFNALPQVCRIPTDLYFFTSSCKVLGGFGKLAKQAYQAWFDRKSAKDLAFHATKYKQRNGWSMTDVLRMLHVRPKDEDFDRIYRYITAIDDPKKRPLAMSAIAEVSGEAGEYLRMIHRLPEMSEKDIAKAMLDYNFPMEVIPTEKRGRHVYEAFVKTAGMTALLRNIRNLINKEVLGIGRDQMAAMELFSSRMGNEAAIKKGRIHPISVLNAYKEIESSAGTNPVWPDIRRILEKTMNLSFSATEPTGKRFMLNLDVSGSMDGGTCAGFQKLTPREGVLAMALHTMRTEGGDKTQMWGFSNGIQRLNIDERTSLDAAIKETQRLPFSSTNCALPMIKALELNIPVDVFVVYTDSETNSYSAIHPVVALQEYRKKMGIPAKLVVFAAVANNFTIADSKDPYMLDVSGIDKSAPQILSAFAKL